MIHQELQVNNEDDLDTISIDQEDESFKYTIVPNSLIRDITISPNCRWLIIYLISNKPGWTIKSRQLFEHTKGFIGRDAIRKVLNEAIEAGYIERTVILRNSHKGKLRGYSYKVASTPKFKKVLRKTGFQGPEHQGPENQGTKEILSKQLLYNNTSLKVPTSKEVIPKEEAIASEEILNSSSVEKKKRIRTPAEFSSKVKDLSEKMVNALKKANPDWIIPKNLHSMMIQIDEMITEENRDPKRIFDILMCVLDDHFWSAQIYNGKINPAKWLRQRFAEFAKKLDSKPPEKFNQIDRRLRHKDGSLLDGSKEFEF